MEDVIEQQPQINMLKLVRDHPKIHFKFVRISANTFFELANVLVSFGVISK